MKEHTFNEGARVSVINMTMSGKFFVEGEAKIIARLDSHERYLVEFVGDSDFVSGEAAVERFVDPAAQENPAEFADWLNKTTANAQRQEKEGH